MKTYEERMQAVQQKVQKKQIRRRILATTAATLCLCIVAGILLIPGNSKQQDIQMYEQSAYYPVIQAINRSFKDTDRTWTDDVVLDGAPGDVDYGETLPGTSAEGNTSIEITDHQVAGVLEGDIIKRSKTHIFYLSEGTLQIYPIAGEQTKLLEEWRIPRHGDEQYRSFQMYLSQDATQMNIVISGYGKAFRADKKDAFVKVISLDVSDPENVKEENSIYISGSYISSRVVEDRLLIMAQYYMDPSIDFADEKTFLPQIGKPGATASVAADGIVIPEKLTDKMYTVVVMLDAQDASLVDSGAFMSYAQDLFVSKERIYAVRNDTETTQTDTTVCYDRMTQIACMNYGKDGLSNAGTFCVEGAVKDPYSMDEYNGVFRVVTETNMWQYPISGSTSAKVFRSANLTCFRVGTWEKLAQVESFSPNGETVESVRFDGDYAYVCTAVVVTLTDPVFFFDMTDLSNIIVKDTGAIEGFSSSLIQLPDGFLMGIGMDEQSNLKVEVYRETSSGVETVCRYTGCDYFARDYKAYYIDRENNLFGIPTGEGYVLLQFDGYQFAEIANVPVTGSLNNVRGVVIDQFLYVFGKSTFAVEKV